jgi:hypothetical protein
MHRGDERKMVGFNINPSAILFPCLLMGVLSISKIKLGLLCILIFFKTLSELIGNC